MTGNGTGRLIAQTGIAPKKSKGQNFLIDDRVAKRHVDFAGIQPGDRVLEIGPGLGVLTKFLIEKTDKLTCIEIDEKLANYIDETYGDRLTLIRGDATKVEYPEFDVMVSNLPYSVSTPIIFSLISYPFRKAIVMVQKEFADRMVADVGSMDYSRLTVNLFYRAECRIVENVPRSRFNPVPQVDSALVEIVPRKAPFSVMDDKTFDDVVRVTFNNRRKKIGTSLKNSGLITKDDDVPYKDERVETLRPAQIAEIADKIYLLNNR